MKGILLLRGLSRSIYLLADEDGVCEVKNYFEENKDNPSTNGYVFGFIKYFNEIKDSGFLKFNKTQKKCWEEKGDKFCELLKGPERLSFFDYSEESKVLILTHFSKHAMKEKREYKRAIRLRKRFEENPVWEEG